MQTIFQKRGSALRAAERRAERKRHVMPDVWDESQLETCGHVVKACRRCGRIIAVTGNNGTFELVGSALEIRCE